MSDEEGFDVRRHKLVPDHEILSDEEIEEMLEKFDIRASQLPKIKSKDPVAKAIGAETGDVVKVTRESPTAGRNEAYRYVI